MYCSLLSHRGLGSGPLGSKNSLEVSRQESVLDLLSEETSDQHAKETLLVHVVCSRVSVCVCVCVCVCV